MNSLQRKTVKTNMTSAPSVSPKLFKAALTAATIEVADYAPAHWKVSYESHDGCVADLILTNPAESSAGPSKAEFYLDAKFSRAADGTTVQTTISGESKDDLLLNQIFDRTQIILSTALT